MYISERDKILNLLDTIKEALDYCVNHTDELNEYVNLSKEAFESIEKFINENAPEFDLKYINADIDRLEGLESVETLQIAINIIELVRSDILNLKTAMKEQIKVRWKALFLPYNASMWTALESIWEAAKKDPNCDATVMPIPYYNIGDPSNISLQYEGERLPDYIPVTSYNQYKIKDQEPEMIFIHNPYDDCNNLTRVPEEYFSSNLKKYTKCLVYSPYFTVGDFNKGYSDFQYAVPGTRNSDRIIVQSEKLKEIFLSYGHPEYKMLAVGSPKIDAIINKMKQPVEIPEEWKEKINGKKVLLLNTHFSYFTKSSQNTNKIGDYAIRFHKEILQTTLNREDCALIWRPHPLLRAMLEARFPKCLAFVNEMEKEIEESYNALIDRTGDYSVAFRCSDALISTYSSLINEYMTTGKPVMIFQKKHTNEAIERAPLNRNLNYFRLNPDGMGFDEFINMVIKGEDPLYESRMEMIKEAFINIDGTAGKKAYSIIRDELLRS